MTTWNEARKQHAPIRQCAIEDAPGAQALWMATKSQGDPEADSFVEAALDYVPSDYASMLAHGGTPNAYAMACLWQHWYVAGDADAFQRREMAREAWGEFETRAKLAGDVETGLGFGGDLAWESTADCDPHKRSLDNIVELAKLAGRMFASMKAAKSEQVAAMPQDLHSVELGANIAQLLPSELMHLGQPTEILLLDNIANQKALQWQYTGVDDAGRGPLVICLDESGSMSGANYRRGRWSKAVAIALTRVAWEDNRTVAVVHWSSSVAITILEPGDGAAMLRMIEHWFNGLNDAALALENGADEVVRLAKRGDKGGDVILVTDGVETITERHEAAIDRIHATGANLWTVGVECHIDEDNPLRARAEHYIHVGGEQLSDGEHNPLAGAVI